MVLVLIVIFLFFLLLIFLSSLLKKDSPKDFSGSYKKIAIENRLAKDTDFKKESSPKDAKENIHKSIELIKNALLQRAVIISYDNKKINKDFDEIAKKTSKEKYKESLVMIKKNIDTVNNALTNYKKSTEGELASIKNALEINEKSKTIVTNQKILGNWATVTLTLPEGYQFSQKRFLKKEDGKWKEMSASFDRKKSIAENLKTLGAPSEIIDGLSVSYTMDLLAPIKY